MTLGSFMWMFALFYCSANAQICVYKECSCYENSTSCANLGLRQLPPLVDARTVTDLTLDNNLITTLLANALPPNIRDLSMMENPLESIEDSAFDNSSYTLASITISSARFSRIPNALGRLNELTEFMIYDTNVSDWNQVVMKNLSNTLKLLILENCSIKIWPAWLKFFKNLTQISFARNFIRTLPDDGLDTVADSITSLDIQNNNLTTVPRAISKLTNLKTLYLSQNQITNLTWLPPNSKLIGLSLDNNKIYDSNQLSKVLRPYGDTLTDFEIYTNSLTSIPDLSFLTKINYLDLSFNQINDPVSGNISPTLSGMSLGFNNLHSVPKVMMTVKVVTTLVLYNNMLTQIRDFEIPPWTTGAEFGSNLISELTDHSFPVNCSIQYISLNINPLVAISLQAFRNLPELTYLNLQSTKLSRLPLGLLSGRKLSSVDFSGSVYLVCTCQEKALMSWIRPLNMYSVSGTCGKTTIYDFFTTLAHDCPT